MQDYIEERVLETAEMIIDYNMTVRRAAKLIGVSKSTVHKDITERLPKLNSTLAKQVNEVMEKNTNERHIRGGIATKKLYERKRGIFNAKDL